VLPLLNHSAARRGVISPPVPLPAAGGQPDKPNIDYINWLLEKDHTGGLEVRVTRQAV
jgi:hypothetical protein